MILLPMNGDELAVILADNLRGYRKRLKYSQEDLAEHADLHRTYIGTIERCEQMITISSLAKLANGLKVEPHHLLVRDSWKTHRKENL
jgi:transcriptional regulator with XRE-family HTH domain